MYEFASFNALSPYIEDNVHMKNELATIKIKCNYL